MDEKRYLIEVLLKARESISQVAQKAVNALNQVDSAEKRNIATTKQADAAAQRRMTSLQRLIESHTREKKALEDSLTALRASAKASREEAEAKRKSAEAAAKSIEASRKASAAARQEADARNKSLEQLQKTSRLEKAAATEKEKRDIEEVRRLRLQIAERNAFEGTKNKAYHAETKRLRDERELLVALNQENAAINRRRASQLDLQVEQSKSAAQAAERSAKAAEGEVKSQESVVAAHQKASSAASDAAASQESAIGRTERAVERNNLTIDRYSDQLEKLNARHADSAQSSGRFTRALDRIGISTSQARQGLRGLNAEFQGFQIALVIKYAQSLISVLVALAAQFVAVAAAAAQAGVGIAAALAAGAAQAVPVVGLLVGAFARLGTILKVVKLRNDQQLAASQNAQRAAKAQQTATDQIRSAEERVADAHRNTARAVEDLARTRDDAARQEQDAQRAVTQARKDAIRTVEDLMAAETDAAQSLLRAQQSRQTAIETGDVTGAVQGDIDVGRARTGLRRARQDAAPARARGVEGIQAVQDAEERLADARRSGARQIQQAEQRLGDARRSERQATDDLSRTRREARDNLAQETAAVNKLADSIAQLSPAERQLYRRILALQDVYKRVARPITDIITRAFTGVVERITSLIQDPRIIRGFRNIATQIAASIRTATGEAGGRESIGAFQILSAEATRNIPIATRILINFFKAVRNLVIDALPAFRLLLGYVEDYSEKARDASKNSRGITQFFKDGVRFAKAFFDLGLSVVGLFLALAGRGGAARAGLRTVRDLTKLVDDLTERVRHNQGRIRRFFGQTHDAFFAILGVLGTLGKAMVESFSADSVKSFADFLNRVIIPAIANVVQLMGAMVTVFHQVFSLPGVAQAAQFVATILLFARGLTVIRSAIGSIGAILPNFLRSMGLLRSTLYFAEGALVTSTAVTPAGWVVLGIMAAIAAIVLLDKKFHFLGPTFRWLKNAASDAFDWVKQAAKDVGDWFSDVWTQGLLYWLRYPFVWWSKNVIGPVFEAVAGVIGDFIGWMKKVFGDDGDLHVVFELFMLPFNMAKGAVKLAFKVIRTIIVGALDLIAGRFDHFGEVMSDFWADFLDVGRGAVSSLLGIVGDLLGALGKIPEIGGPFKKAAEDVHDAQRSIDDLRDRQRAQREEQKKANDTIKDAAPTLVNLRKRYDEAKDRLDKLTPGTDRYKEAVKKSRDAHRDYNEKLRDTAAKMDNARQPTRKLRSNIANLGDTSADTADVIAKNLNDVLRQVGARTIRLNTRAYRKSGIDVITEATGHAATGGVLSRAHGLRRRLWGGGVPNPYGGAGDDHVLYSPSGMPVAAMSGTEGIVNTPQMGVINGALGLAKQMGAMPWGSLNELWGSGMRHYATGGGLQPAIRNLSNRLNRMFGTITTSTVRPGGTSLHRTGMAADISGTPDAMSRAARYIRSTGIWRSLLEGIHQPGLSVKNGQMVPPSFWGASTWNDHIDHIHLAIQKLVGGISTRIRQPRISGLGEDALSRIARGSSRMLTRAANRYIRRQMARLGGADPRAMGADANVVGAFRRAIRVSGANAKERLALWEAGIVESGLKNLNYGDRDSLGALQERTSIYGRAHALNPFASAMRFLNQVRALRPWRGTAGSLAQAVQRSGFPGRYDQVRSRAMRFMQTGGRLGAGQVGPGALSQPAVRRFDFIGRALGPVMKKVNELFGNVTGTLEDVARGPLRRSKNLVIRIQKAFSRLTDENGLLDQLRAQVEVVTARAAFAIQRRQFRVGPEGPRRLARTDSQLGLDNLRGLQAARGALTDEREGIQGGIAGAQRALQEARRRNNRRAAAAARAALVNLRARLQTNAEALAQNAQDQVEAQESFQQGLLDEANNAAERSNASIDRWQRTAKALGHKLDPNAVISYQIGVMRRQIGDLQGVLERARRTGNVALARTITDQIADLNVQIAEAAAQQFQNAIDAVNDAATRRGASLDRRSRLAQLGGRTDFAAMGNILRDRGSSLVAQRTGLLGLLAQAQASGNVEQVENLVDQIDELNVQLAENTQAVHDNTDAAFNFTTQLINSAAEFGQGVFGGAQGFFQALQENTGVDTTRQQATALRGVGSTLATQRRGLTSQLASLVGRPDLIGLTGANLVNALVALANNPSTLAGLDPTQQDAFKDLVTALIGNATAIEQNTKALNDLTSPGAQGFSSTLWTTFRSAVFTGAGGLLPNYQMVVPTAAVGARVRSSGMLMVHTGEEVRPAAVTRDWSDSGGDTYNLNVTSPTEVLNPSDVGRQLAFYRKSRRGR